MAPVGSYESLMAAIQGGADSIYFGIEGLNMRSRSSNNFTTDDFAQDRCAFVVSTVLRAILTVNRLFYGGRPASDARDYRCGEGGGSFSDHCGRCGSYELCQQHRTGGASFHTAQSISNAEALKFYARFADVVVLARELNLKQVHEIYRQIVDQQITGPKGETDPYRNVCPRSSLYGRFR